MTPSSNSCCTSAGDIRACSSISRTSGRTLASANSRMLSRKIRSSSESAVSGGVLSAVSWVTESSCVKRSARRRSRRGWPVQPLRTPRNADVIIALSAAAPCGESRIDMRAQSRTVTLALILASVAAGLSLNAQDPAPAPATQPPQTAAPPADQTPVRAQQPPIRTGINFVRVDVIVTDGKGEPVLDLKAEDFTVTEDNKPQKVESFSVVKIDAVEQSNARPTTAIRTDFDEEREAARADVRLFVLLLDDYHVRRGNDMAVRKPLIEFIQNQLDPADMLAVMYPLTPVADIHFSRNRDAAAGAINGFEGRKFN